MSRRPERPAPYGRQPAPAQVGAWQSAADTTSQKRPGEQARLYPSVSPLPFFAPESVWSYRSVLGSPVFCFVLFAENIERHHQRF
jgi:hypothetical protein